MQAVRRASCTAAVSRATCARQTTDKELKICGADDSPQRLDCRQTDLLGRLVGRFDDGPCHVGRGGEGPALAEDVQQHDTVLGVVCVQTGRQRRIDAPGLGEQQALPCRLGQTNVGSQRRMHEQVRCGLIADTPDRLQCRPLPGDRQRPLSATRAGPPRHRARPGHRSRGPAAAAAVAPVRPAACG